MKKEAAAVALARSPARFPHRCLGLFDPYCLERTCQVR